MLVFNLSDYRAKYDIKNIYVGDIVEWKDFNDRLYECKVLGIHRVGTIFDLNHNSLPSFSMESKRAYAIVTENGMTISADVVTKKVIKEKKPLRKTRCTF